MTFFKKIRKSRALGKKVGKSRKSRTHWSACVYGQLGMWTVRYLDSYLVDLLKELHLLSTDILEAYHKHRHLKCGRYLEINVINISTECLK